MLHCCFGREQEISHIGARSMGDPNASGGSRDVGRGGAEAVGLWMGVQ